MYWKASEMDRPIQNEGQRRRGEKEQRMESEQRDEGEKREGKGKDGWDPRFLVTLSFLLLLSRASTSSS